MTRSLTIDEYVDLWSQARGSGQQGDVARHLGMTPQYLSQILNGVRTPSHAKMEEIALRSGGMVGVDSWQRRAVTNDDAR